jgi:adenylate cyclase
MALPLPELPSIAVLPFVNLSEDPKQQLLCDAITDNIINALSKVPRLFVIARNSTFVYKGKAVKVKQVSEELGVRYVLEGSFQRSDDRVRITAQLVDALTGHPLLAERYDGETTDLFALQDDITMKVLGAVRVKLEGLGGSAWMKYYKGTQGLDCFMKLQQSFSHIQRMTIPDNNQARQIAEEGLAMCPEGPGFYRLLANVNLNDIQLGSSKDPRESIEKAEELLQKALAIDDNNAEAHGNLSQVYTRKREYDRAVAEAERGVALDPGSSWALYRYGIVSVHPRQ